MEILNALGVDSSVGLQMVIFLVAFLALKSLVFSPYVQAYEEREKRTSGQTKAAEGLFTEAEVLRAQYQDLFKKHNEEMQQIYSGAKKEAELVQASQVMEARAKANKIVDDARVEISNQLAAASSSIKAEVNSLSALITEKLIGREL